MTEDLQDETRDSLMLFLQKALFDLSERWVWEDEFQRRGNYLETVLAFDCARTVAKATYS